MADQATPPDESEVDSEPETIDHETLSDDPVDTEPQEETTELDPIQEQNVSLIADLQRIKAEFDNFRRQNAKRQAELVEQAGSALAAKLLPVLDACDAGIQQGLDDVIPIRNSLIETLEAEGLEVVAHSGVEFDPERHEAVLHETTDELEITTVDEIMRSGYLWKGRTIRPAMVRTIGPS